MVGLGPIAKKVIQRFIYLKLYLLSSGAPYEAKLHFCNISSFMGLDFWESGFSFEFGGGHKPLPLPLSCYATLLIGSPKKLFH